MTAKLSKTEEIAYLPNHIAIIMDGNGRWAEKHGLTRLEGHNAGFGNIRPTVTCLNDEYHIKYVTLYAFSTENWNRPKEEVDYLLKLLEERIDEESRELNKHNVKMRHLGSPEGLPDSVKQAINRALELTQKNTGMVLSFAFNYGGRNEILDAVRRIMTEGIPARKINEKLFGNYLYTVGLPDVDLLIRTSGELRLSNFLVWQTAYSEYYFTDVLWPDFDKEELKKALVAYSQRKRRFGGL